MNEDLIIEVSKMVKKLDLSLKELAAIAEAG